MGRPNLGNPGIRTEIGVQPAPTDDLRAFDC
jgi:hypothetical protein